MMLHLSRRGLIGIGLLVGALILGSLLGGMPARASARTTGAPPPVAGKYCRIYVQNLASSLHVSESELQSANHSALQATIQQAYSSGNLTKQQESDLLNKLSQSKDPCVAVDRVVATRANLAAARGAIFTAVANKLDESPATLESQLDSCKLLEQAATSKGVSIDAIKSTYLSAVQDQLNSAVRQGTLTEAQATQAHTAIEKAVAQGKYPLLCSHQTSW